MDEALRWLLVNGQQVGVVGLLLAFVIALQRKLIVPGYVYRECQEDRADLERKAEIEAERMYERMLSAERELSALREATSRSSGRRSP